MATKTLTASAAIEDGQDVEMSVKIPASLDDEAEGRIHAVMRREATRIADISRANLRDQVARPAEAKRIREAPKDRSAVTVGVGSKAPDAAIVTRGSVEVAGKVVSAETSNAAPEKGQA